MPYDPDNPRYKCCCGCCRSTTGAIMVSILDIVVAAIALWQGLTGRLVFIENAQYSEYEYLIRQCALVACGIFGTIGLLTVFGVVCRLPCLLIFHMVVDICVLLGFGLLAALIILITFVASTGGEYQGNPIKPIIFLAILCAFALLQIWYFLIMLSAYRALSEDDPRRAYETTGPNYTMVANNGAGTSAQRPYYFMADAYASESGAGKTLSPAYTPEYKQRLQYTTTSPSMYG